MAVLRGSSPSKVEPIRQRPIWMVIVLTLLSLGLYLIVWFGQTWSELRRVIGNSGMRPFWHALAFLVPILNLLLVLDHFRTINQQSGRRRLSPAIAPGIAVAGIAAGGLASFVADLIPNTPGGLSLALALIGALLLTAVIARGQRALNRIWAHDFGAGSEMTPAPGEWIALVALTMAFGLVVYHSLLG